MGSNSLRFLTSVDALVERFMLPAVLSDPPPMATLLADEILGVHVANWKVLRRSQKKKHGTCSDQEASQDRGLQQYEQCLMVGYGAGQKMWLGYSPTTR